MCAILCSNPRQVAAVEGRKYHAGIRGSPIVCLNPNQVTAVEGRSYHAGQDEVDASGAPVCDAVDGARLP